MIDENGMPDVSLPAKTMNAGGRLAAETSKAARRCLPVLYAKRDAKALGVSTDALIENTQKVMDSNLPDGLKAQTVAMMQTTFAHRGSVEATVRIAVDSGRIKDDADPDALDDEWVENFVEHVQKVSDEEVRQTWANLLVEEINEPGSFSKRTMSILADMSRADAELFKKLCSLCIGGEIKGLEGKCPVKPFLVIGDDGVSYSDAILYSEVKRLEAFGLVFEGKDMISFPFGGRHLFCFGGNAYMVTCVDGGPTEIEFENFMLSPFGDELARLCSIGSYPGFAEYVADNIRGRGFDVVQVPVSSQ